MKPTDIKKWGRWRIAWVNTENLDTVSQLLKGGEIDGVGLSQNHGFDGDTGILDTLPSFAGIVIADNEVVDSASLARFRDIRFLTLGERRAAIDFTQFRGLIDLRINWKNDDTLPDSRSSLESLYLMGYKPKTKDLSLLPISPYLRELELVQAGLANLEGVQKQSALTEVQISYCSSLVSVAALTQSLIELVHLEACKRINDLQSLSGCQRLKMLRLADCGKLQSLNFLDECQSLEEFRFVNTKIVDGDMSPLLRLKRVGFIAKRSYTHTPDEVRAIIASRYPDSASPPTPHN
jgi:protein phosphatase 1 regulatory subunit 7